MPDYCLSGRLAIERAERRSGVLMPEEIAALAADDRTHLQLLLVRCGCCRFMCAAQDCAHLTKIVTREGSDYVRDVSLYTVGSRGNG